MRKLTDQFDNADIAEEEDDGRTIADMNVEGMPWYHRSAEDHLRWGQRGSGQGQNQMSDEEIRMYRWAAVKAGLILALIFGAVFALFIAFCDFVWFR